MSMNASRKHKKKLIVSYKNLSEDLLELFKEAYPEGYRDYIQRTVKPNGESIFVVPLETDDTTYMIKIEVKVDSALAADEEMDKDFYGDDDDKEMDFDTLDSIDKDSDNPDHTEHHLHHGDYEDIESPHKIKKNAALSKELAEAFADDEDFDDEYNDDKPEGNEDEEPDDFEPSEEDLIGIEDEFDLPEEKSSSTKKSTPKKTKATKETKATKTTKTTKTAKSTKTAKAATTKTTKVAKESKATKEAPKSRSKKKKSEE